jgi:phosphoribosylglycinamide formyltransferase 1
VARLKLGILISGRGSNMQALIHACSSGIKAEVRLVLSNEAQAAGLAHARSSGIATSVVSHRKFTDRAAFDEALHQSLERAEVDFVCLAGFMRLLTPDFVNKWHDRMINIHPSLLPAFPGLHTHRRALAAGVKLSGCTVHFVRAETDTGPIIAQAAVPVLPDDDEERLAARVLQVEHRLYPLALRLITGGWVRVQDERALVVAPQRGDEALFNPPD